MTDLLAHPLGWSTITVLTFIACTKLYDQLGRTAALQPVLITIVLLAGGLITLNVPYVDYAGSTRMMTVWLTPAIISLAVPLYENLALARERAASVGVTIVVGGTLIMIGAAALGTLAGLSVTNMLPLLTKSVSAPIAIGIAEETGAPIDLTIVCVFSTGLPGAVVAPAILRWIGVTDEATRGLVLGITCHAFGIARAAEIGPRATAFATLGMGLMGCFAAIAIPLALALS